MRPAVAWLYDGMIGFNSRIREDATTCRKFLTGMSSGFNSRIREDATVEYLRAGGAGVVSIHASVRMRRAFHGKYGIIRGFNSRIREDATSLSEI